MLQNVEMIKRFKPFDKYFICAIIYSSALLRLFCLQSSALSQLIKLCLQLGLYFQEQIKDSKIAIIKIARKLLNRIRLVLINQQPYKLEL